MPGVMRVFIGPRRAASPLRTPRAAEGSGRLRIVARLAKLIYLCTTRSSLPTLPKLAKELRVCERTVRRDLHAIALAGVPVPPGTVPRSTSETSRV